MLILIRVFRKAEKILKGKERKKEKVKAPPIWIVWLGSVDRRSSDKIAILCDSRD